MANHLALERFWWFDGEIRKGHKPNATALARQFELHRKTAQRDIEFFRDRLHAPLEYDGSQRGYRYSDDSFSLPGLWATEQQLLALLLARQLLHADGARLDRDLKQFADQLLAAVSDRRFDAAHLDHLFSATWTGHSPADPGTFRTVLTALTHQRLLRIRYTSPHTGKSGDREVEPHHLQYYQGSWSLLGRCREADDWRKFYLARMERIQTLDDTFIPRPKGEWQGQLEGAFGIFQGDEVQPVRLRFSAVRARAIREQFWHEQQQLSSLPDGRLELVVPVADFREIRLKVLQFGADVEVLEPEELRREIFAEVERMKALYVK